MLLAARERHYEGWPKLQHGPAKRWLERCVPGYWHWRRWRPSGAAHSRTKTKKTDDLKPADPDTGESTVEEGTLGLLPNPFEKQGVAYEDRINFATDVDFEKLIGLKQLTFHANVFQIDGGGLSRGALLNFLVVSGIEALPTTRLYEIAFEQKWETKVAWRAGQLAADTEFMTAKYTDVFTNSSLGWPAGFASNMPSGGHHHRWRPWERGCGRTSRTI